MSKNKSNLEKNMNIEEQITDRMKSIIISNEILDENLFSEINFFDYDSITFENCTIPDIKFSQYLPNLKKLNLEKNGIKHISGFENIPNIIELNLASNKLTEIPSFFSLTNLIILNLSNNEISEIVNISHLRNLKKLKLFNNRIDKIKNLKELGNLEELNLSQNQISVIENLENLVSLKELYLSRNLISIIEGLDTLISLKILSLSFNQIQKIDGLNLLSQLEYLDLEFNLILTLENLECLSNLSIISIGKNPLIIISPSFIKNTVPKINWNKGMLDLMYMPPKLADAFKEKNIPFLLDYYQNLERKRNDIAIEMQKHNYNNIINELKQKLTLDPDNSQILRELGEIHSKLGQYLEAEEYFLKAIGHVKHKFGETPDEDLLKKAFDTKKEEIDYIALIKFYEEYQQYRCAVMWWERFLNLFPKSYIGIRQFANLNCVLGRFPRAVKILRLILDPPPKDLYFWNLYFYCLKKLGKLEEAESAYDQMQHCSSPKDDPYPIWGLEDM
jgi:pentatricopeptide repeat protein